MKSEIVSVAQLKSGLSKYLAKARSGQTIEVTSHRKVIARVVGVSEPVIRSLPGGLAQMAADGKLAPGNGQRLSFAAPIRLADGGQPLSELVLEDRGPR